MTDRVVKVILRGQVQDFIGGMRAASSAARATASSITDGSKESTKYRQNLTALGTTAGKIGLVAAGGVALAIRAYANFDQAISNVAATGDDARRNIDDLREAAIKFGASTQFSATEAANAIEELEKAGVNAKDILGGGLKGSLDLAAAGSLGVADAASIAATAMVQFGLDGDKVPHIADLLAAAAGKAQGSVEDMGQALKYVGPVASQMGISIEETTGTIAELANSGILADQAGTSLRGMLTSLTSPSKIAANTLEQYNIQLYDAQGNFVGFKGVAGQLHDSLGRLGNAERDQALGRIFGNEQITAARILYAGGAADVDKWTKSVNDSGYAQDVAKTKMDNLKGDLEQLKGAFETALIGTGEGANGPLRDTVQLLTGLVNAYNALPGPIKTTLLATAGLTAAVGGSAFVISRAIGGYADMKRNLGEVGGAFEAVNKKTLAFRAGAAAAGVGLAALSGPAHDLDDDLGTLTDAASAAALGFAVGGPWGAAIAGGASLLSTLGGESQRTKDQIDGLTSTLDQQTGAVTKNSAVWLAKSLQDSGAADSLQQVGIGLQTATDAALGNADAMSKVKAALDILKGQEGGSQQFQNGDYSDQRKALESLLALNKGIKGQGEVTKNASDTSEKYADAQNSAADAGKVLQSQVEQTTEELKKQHDAATKTADSFFDLSEDAKEAKRSLHDWISDLDAQAKALEQFTSNARKAGKRGLEEGLIQQLEQLGPEGAARLKQLADASDREIGRANSAYRRGQRAIDNYTEAATSVPPVSIEVQLGNSLDRLATLRAAIARVHGKAVNVSLSGDDEGARARAPRRHGGTIGRAFGGSVVGPGTGTSDSIPAVGPGAGAYLLSNGEHIFTADEVNKIGGQAATYALREQIRNGQFAAMAQRRADGGSVSTQVAPAPVITTTSPRAIREALEGMTLHIPGLGSTRLSMFGG